jgi:NOL1/NOP2/sun family putative RNA methylase
MTHKRHIEPKPLFLERMQKLLPDEKDFKDYLNILKKEPVRSLRCNTLKISVKELENRFKQKKWQFSQPFKDYPDIFNIESILNPGELGRSLEHQLGYYYIQEIASMLPVLTLNPKPNETVLDLCSSPGSKTTQIAAFMKNKGTIIANEVSFGRIQILGSNLQRCGVSNTIITKKDGIILCQRLVKQGIKLDKILIDAPCSGEGTLRSTPKTYLMWNPKTIKNLSKLQKALVTNAIELLKPKGELVYSTCTHAPEENESVVNFILKNFPEMRIEKIILPVKCRPGINSWEDEDFNQEVNNSCRIYPQDNNTEGFFIAKFKKLK